ncbi:precorrin-2 C(20)-methyltransferase [Desulfopila inferna]|uniref:precorrin-2 C(20)-methyltransferase n=1 Tax=Desulfopila inferna TaxID=468528 RepID=UPI001966C568|nr:precorrin-2 C(20)-methyltransferase [Desulfopila inferna]MBM9603674.1 precorrin-2 C(20)-methyltransferase [Desulfopila inferna]
MKGRFYVVGVGPGDPELMTLKAVRILKKSPVWLAPAAHKNGNSTALGIASGLINGEQKEILTHHFPMKKVHAGQPAHPEVERAWQEAAAIIADHLENGRDVAFPTLGDPAIYSTGFYIFETLMETVKDMEVEIIPGVSAIGATSAAAAVPLCLGNERMVVIPATFEDDKLKEILENFDCVVLMKVHRVMPRLVGLFEELNLLDKAVLVERTSLQEQRIRRDLQQAALEEIHYFSTMIVRKA